MKRPPITLEDDVSSPEPPPQSSERTPERADALALPRAILRERSRNSIGPSGIAG